MQLCSLFECINLNLTFQIHYKYTTNPSLFSYFKPFFLFFFLFFFLKITPTFVYFYTFATNKMKASLWSKGPHAPGVYQWNASFFTHLNTVYCVTGQMLKHNNEFLTRHSKTVFENLKSITNPIILHFKKKKSFHIFCI